MKIFFKMSFACVIVVGLIGFVATLNAGPETREKLRADTNAAVEKTKEVAKDVAAASNGDIWVGRTCCSDSRLNRLRGTSWTTYTQQLNGSVYLNDVTAIGEDGSGNIWIGDNGGAVRFDGTTWRRYTTADGLIDNQVRQIVRDSRGRLWFLAGFGNTGGLSVFDGATWHSFDHTDGLPQVMDLGPIFADSSGRIWASVSGPLFAERNVGMFDGSEWHYFGSPETGGALYGRPSAFAENSAGAVWMPINGGAIASTAIYQDGTWSRGPGVGATYSSLLFDAHDNLWYGSPDLSVRWGGIDHRFIDGAQLGTLAKIIREILENPASLEAAATA